MNTRVIGLLACCLIFVASAPAKQKKVDKAKKQLEKRFNDLCDDLEDGSIGNIDPNFDDVFKNLDQACSSLSEIESNAQIVTGVTDNAEDGTKSADTESADDNSVSTDDDDGESVDSGSVNTDDDTETVDEVPAQIDTRKKNGKERKGGKKGGQKGGKKGGEKGGKNGGKNKSNVDDGDDDNDDDDETAADNFLEFCEQLDKAVKKGVVDAMSSDMSTLMESVVDICVEAEAIDESN